MLRVSHERISDRSTLGECLFNGLLTVTHNVSHEMYPNQEAIYITQNMTVKRDYE